jgi:hypothetical protein
MAVYNEEVIMTIGPTVDVAAATARTWTDVVPGPSGAKWEVVEAHLLPDTAITANGTNFTTFTLANATTAVTITSRAYSAVNSVANTKESLTLVAAAKFVTAGDTITWAKADSGTGLAAGCRCRVRLKRIL